MAQYGLYQGQSDAACDDAGGRSDQGDRQIAVSSRMAESGLAIAEFPWRNASRLMDAGCGEPAHRSGLRILRSRTEHFVKRGGFEGARRPGFHPGYALGDEGAGAKVFCFFFSKKTAFLTS